MTNLSDILQNYPHLSYNSGRKIVRETLEKFLEKPGRDLEAKLRKFGIGVTWSHEYGEEPQQVEGFYLMDKEGTEEPISDEELGELLK